MYERRWGRLAKVLEGLVTERPRLPPNCHKRRITRKKWSDFSYLAN
jgi:hypothetical protein